MSVYYVYALKQDFPPRRKGHIAQVRADLLPLSTDEERFLMIHPAELEPHQRKYLRDESDGGEFLYDQAAGKILHRTGSDALALVATRPDAFSYVSSYEVATALRLPDTSPADAGRELYNLLFSEHPGRPYPQADDPIGEQQALVEMRREYVRALIPLAESDGMAELIWASRHGSMGNIVQALRDLPASTANRIQSAGIFSANDLNVLGQARNL